MLKNSKGALVVLKGFQVGNLYKLFGNTIVDDADVPVDNDDILVRL